MTASSKNQKAKNTFAVLGFILSALIGFALLTLTVWGDVEAAFFDANFRGEKRLASLSCPVLITPQDKAEFSARFDNPLEKTINRRVRVHTSSGTLLMKNEDNIQFQLEPEESRKLAWQVNPKDAAYGKVVMVNVYLFDTYYTPSRHGTCGILVLNLPVVTGRQIVYSGIGISFLGMIGTIGYFRTSNQVMTRRQRELFRGLTIMGASIAVGILTGLLGNWLIGTIALVVALMSAISTINQQLK